MPGIIPLELAGAPEIEVDGNAVARAFGLEVDQFRQLMEQRKITLLCERGTGEDAGLYRASFYHGTMRVRLVVDGAGTPVPGGFSVEGMPAAAGRDAAAPDAGQGNAAGPGSPSAP